MSTIMIIMVTIITTITITAMAIMGMFMCPRILARPLLSAFS